MKELVTALNSAKTNNQKQVIVPIFQRGKRWDKEDEKSFYETLNKGLPFGTMLFHRSVENNIEKYLLIDGLQRSNTIKKYLLEPTKYVDANDIPTQLIDELYAALNLSGNSKEIRNRIIDTILEFIQNLDDINNIQYYDYAKLLINTCASDTDNIIDVIQELVKPFFNTYRDRYKDIESTEIPVIIYTGDQESLPEVFKRINSTGKALSQYEIYAATWPKKDTFFVNNEKIVDNVLKKYDLLIDDDYSIDGYDREQKRKTQLLNSFEYAFGLGKYLYSNYEIFQYPKSRNDPDGQIEPIGFEILNACLGDNHKDLNILYKKILNIDINKFTDRLIEVITFVNEIIQPVCNFKSNTRKQSKILHSKYQIISMISSTFREKYDIANLSVSKKTWDVNRKILKQNLLLHYVYDIIENNWKEGGLSKIHTINKENKYLNEIPKELWSSTLNNWFQKSLLNKNETHNQIDKVVFLNCIYLHIFSAYQQLSDNKFDIEHIAPKKQMNELIEQIHSPGLNISSVANLCYLPEKLNRVKKDKTIYQVGYEDKELLAIEDRYTFTQENDLDWLTVLDYDYQDYEVLESLYHKYLSERFEKQKEKFFVNMKIVDRK